MKKNLLIATDNFLPRWDGIARFLIELMPYIKKEFAITIIAPKFYGKINVPKNVKLIRMPLRNFSVADYTPAKVDRKKLKKAVKEADIVFSQSLGPIGIAAIKYANKNKKKVVSFIHSLEWELFAASMTRFWILNKMIMIATKVMVRSMYNKCDILITPSSDMNKKLNGRGIKTKKKVVSLGTDIAKFIPVLSKDKAKRKLGLPKKFIIGYCGRIGREKDLMTLKKSFLKLQKKYPVALLIVGGGNKSEEERLYSPGVIMVGSKDDVVPYLQAMDVYVLPSLTETSSLSTMEAMSCGLPVVCTRVGSIPNYVSNGKNGYLFNRGDVKVLTKKIKRLIEDDNLRLKIGKEARKKIVKDCRWDISAKNIVEILKKEVIRK